MTKTKAPAEQPAAGGSYIRNADGSLSREEWTEPSDGPDAEPAETADEPADAAFPSSQPSPARGEGEKRRRVKGASDA